VTNYRRSVLTGDRIRYLNAISGKARSDLGAVPAGRTGEHDHVHQLAGYAPKVSVAAPVNSLKGASARMPRQRYQIPTHREHLWSPPPISRVLRGCAADDHPAAR